MSEHDNPDAPVDKPSNEAAKYRTRLREAEARLAELETRVVAFQRAEVERIVAEHLAAPADLFDVAHAELANFLTDDGTVDKSAVETAATNLVEARPGLARQVPREDVSQARQSDGPTSGPSWSALLRG